MNAELQQKAAAIVAWMTAEQREEARAAIGALANVGTLATAILEEIERVEAKTPAEERL